MTNEFYAVILSSSLLSAFISSAIGLRTKQNEYRNEYYKIVLERRLGAYEEIEKLIMNLKTAVLDDDNGLYHIVFGGEGDDPNSLFQLLFRISGLALWLSDDLFLVTREITVLLTEKHPSDGDWIAFGKKHYREFGEFRTRLERLHARDLLSLHNVEQFLRSKKPSDGYTPVRKSRA